MDQTSLHIHDLEFSVHYSDRRKTLGLSVSPEGSLVLSVPRGCDRGLLERFAHAKLEWVYTKLAEREHLSPPPLPRRFVPGESYPYKGRWYRLRFSDESTPTVPLRLEHEWFVMRRDALSNARDHFLSWYQESTLTLLQERIQRFTPYVWLFRPEISVRELGTRWAIRRDSEAHISFHWVIGALPLHIVDYLVARELLLLTQPKKRCVEERLESFFTDAKERENWLHTQSRSFVIVL